MTIFRVSSSAIYIIHGKMSVSGYLENMREDQ
jgi:hypothetical protein